MVSTRLKLIDTAEALFAEKGFDIVSVREITSAADCNLASINYYFDSKEGLIRAIVRKNFLFVFRERMALLESAKKEARGRPLTVSKIVYAFIKPVCTLVETRQHAKKLFCRIMSWMLQSHEDSNAHREAAGGSLPTQVGIEKELFEMVDCFAAELRRSLPHLTLETSIFSIHYMFSTITMTLMHSEGVSLVSKGQVTYGSVVDHLGEIVSYCAAGIHGVATRNHEQPIFVS